METVARGNLPHRVAILAPGELFGGAERQILTLLRAVPESRWPAPLLLTFHDRELAQRARELGIRTEILGGKRILDVQALARLRQILTKERIEIVNVHGYRATVYLSLVAAGRRLVAVKTEHGAVESDGHRLRTMLYRWLENWATRRLDAVIIYVTKDLEARCAQECAGLSHNVIYNGIEPVHPPQFGKPPEFDGFGFNLVSVGRLERVKGQDIAIRALADEASPKEARLHLVGTGPERESLENLATALGVRERISFLGFRSNVYEYIAHADALLISSRHEGLPYVLLEALSLRTPVIASSVGGIAEVLKSGDTALLVDGDNPASLAAAISQLSQSPELRQRLGRLGVELVNKKFTAALMATQYMAAFDAAIASRTVARNGLHR